MDHCYVYALERGENGYYTRVNVAPCRSWEHAERVAEYAESLGNQRYIFIRAMGPDAKRAHQYTRVDWGEKVS